MKGKEIDAEIRLLRAHLQGIINAKDVASGAKEITPWRVADAIELARQCLRDFSEESECQSKKSR